MTTQTPRVNVDGLSLTLRSRQAKYSFWVSIVYCTIVTILTFEKRGLTKVKLSDPETRNIL